MCNCTVNWCDKLRFFAFIFAVLLPIIVTWQGEVVNSRIGLVTRYYIFIFIYVAVETFHELIPILTFRLTQCHDLDHPGSRDVIVHVTIRIPIGAALAPSPYLQPSSR